MARDQRIDTYIARQADFARPILEHIRAVILAASPEIGEDVKWSMPAFMYKGRQIANMAGFKAHVAFGFWRREAAGAAAQEGAMGQFGRIASLADLPTDKELVDMVRQAMALVDAGGAVRKAAPAPKPPLATPNDLQAALDAVPEAAANWAAFPPGGRREYVEWVEAAKRAETREKRIATTVAQCAEGKTMQWKYR